MEFKTKKLITKFRRYTSILIATILLATAFSLRILANRGGIMKNIAMADSKDVIEKVEYEKNNLQTGENNEIEINQKESDLFEDNKNVIENNSFQPNSDVFYTLTSGENINYIDYKNNILNFSMIINAESKSVDKENKSYESATNNENNLNKNTVYKQILTSDAIGVYSAKYTKLPDDAYSFTKVTIPGKDNFSFSNEKSLLNGKYTIKIMALNKGKTRKFKNYETIYEGEWKNEDIIKNLGDIKAVRVEVSGLEEEINNFNITIEGNADISSYLSTDSNVVFNNQDIVEIDKISALNKRKYKVCIWGKIYRASLFDNFRFREKIIYEDDDSYYYLVDKARRIALLNESLYYYYMSDNSVMRNNSQYKRTDFIDVYERRIDYFIKKRNKVLLHGSYERFCIVLMLFYSKCICEKNNRNDLDEIIALFEANYEHLNLSKVTYKRDALLLFSFHISHNVTGRLLKLFIRN